MLDSFLQFIGVDQTCTVFVDFDELDAKGLDLVLVGHFHKHVHCSFFKLRNALECLESLQNLAVKSLFFTLVGFHFFKPNVLQGLTGRKSLCRVDN